MNSKKKILVIGGGIAGLRVAAGLDTMVYDVEVVSPEFGGLLSQHEVTAFGEQFRFDLGGHVYGKGTIFEEYIRDLPETVYHQRDAYYVELGDDNQGNWVNYPVQDFAQDLNQPLSIVTTDASGWQEGEDFEDLAQRIFGNEFVSQWFEPFNERVWASWLSEMDTDWVAGRVKAPDPDKKGNKNWGPNNEFAYCPGNYFIDQLYTECVEGGVTMTSGYAHLIGGAEDGPTYYQLTAGNTTYKLQADIVINTTSIKRLYEMVTEDQYHDDVQDTSEIIANRVQYIGVACKRAYTGKPFTWAYGDIASPIHRMTLLSRYHSDMAPAGCESFLFEIPMAMTGDYSDDAEYIRTWAERYMREFGYDVSEYEMVEFNSLGYPIPTLGTREVIAEMKRQLIEYGIYSIGRWGSHAYLNADNIFDEADNLASLLNGDVTGTRDQTYLYSADYYKVYALDSDNKDTE